jgi:hypothetical protein
VHEKVTILCFLSGVPIIQDHQIFYLQFLVRYSSVVSLSYAGW